MIIHFYLRYHTSIGQTIFVSGNTKILGNDNPAQAFPLSYFNNEFWHGEITIPDKGFSNGINYRYILRDENNVDTIDADKDKIFYPANYVTKEISLIDAWNAEQYVDNVFYTKPFQQILLKHEHKTPKVAFQKITTHEFKVKAPLLSVDECVCITGAGNIFKNWNLKKLLPLQPEGNWYTIKINLSKEVFPVEYKYGVYNVKSKTFIYENGANRILKSLPLRDKYTINHDGFLNLQKRWKGTGVAIPVFSLRSSNGFGTGEFNDIKLLVDWAYQAGIKLLQVLPVNDTVATHTAADSYPYAAISAFALHPLYINIEAVAGREHLSLVRALNKKKKSLNSLSRLDYEGVMKFKFFVLKELYEAKKNVFLTDTNYVEFFNLNKSWLIPYAAFCFLRDKNQTADFAKWKSHSIYNKEAIQRLTAVSQPHFDEIGIHYFIQYHLHLQLKEASQYAHEKGIILKGDIPIGVSRNSCDVWMDRPLYNTNEQAGAPPDDFAVNGQNWGFPTYNWKNMQQDNFEWWRRRFAQMNEYFDAFRIDHILGFFRIWSIPENAVQGILGRFVPAVPIHVTEFVQNGILFDYERFCHPYITENILLQFGEHYDFIKHNFLISTENFLYKLKQDFNTQRKIENYFQTNFVENSEIIKANLFGLVSNIILIEEEGSEMQHFHFQISMHTSTSFQSLDPFTQNQLSNLYTNYFFTRQDLLWKQEALKKLPSLKNSTDMLICGEDLGMVPHCVPEVMNQTGILSLEVQRMPKTSQSDFFHPKNAPYLSVVTPSTHDMSTIREWWQEDRQKTQKFYNFEMGHYGEAPLNCQPWINKEIILQHLYSPAMWSIFQIQDLLGMSENLKRAIPDDERINQPSNPNHIWNYRMHIALEDLIKEKEFNTGLRTINKESQRV